LPVMPSAVTELKTGSAGRIPFDDFFALGRSGSTIFHCPSVSSVSGHCESPFAKSQSRPTLHPWRKFKWERVWKLVLGTAFWGLGEENRPPTHPIANGVIC
jgi:hypothetical protein